MGEYRTVLRPAYAEFIEKHSRFIGSVSPVTSEEEAVAFISEMRSKYWDATHNVYAYCLRDGQIRRFSDDGEPQGTAGMPTLDVLQKEGICDVVVVITRYFGGIMLGAGGLVHAYSHSTKIALEAAGIVTMSSVIECSISCEYHQYGKIAALISSFNAIIESSVFETDVKIIASIDSNKIEKFKAELFDIMGGSDGFEQIREKYAVLK